jgi:hypothetical protein
MARYWKRCKQQGSCLPEAGSRVYSARLLTRRLTVDGPGDALKVGRERLIVLTVN